MAYTRDTRTRSYPRVHTIRDLSESAYVLRFDRGDMAFDPGQYVSVGLRGDINMREYSIYSPADADYLEILVKEVDAGHVSRRLRTLAPGDELEVDGPFGFFVIDEAQRRRGEFLFVATGTGISPFHCFAASYPDLRYRLIHGVRTANERYEHASFPAHRVTSCLSRDSSDAADIVAGRVTDYLHEHPVDPGTLCYLCGNCDMIYEAFDILKGHGVAPEQLYAEVYF